MGRCPTIETERLVLRPFREDDVDAYTEMLQSAEVRAALHLPDDVGREQAWNGMAAWLGQWELRGTGQWAVVDRTTGSFLGRTGMHYPERDDWPGIEIGWAGFSWNPVTRSFSSIATIPKRGPSLMGISIVASVAVAFRS